MVSIILIPLILFYFPNLQNIALSFIPHLYATINHLKVNHIVYCFAIGIGGYQISFPDDPVSPDDSLIETKYLLNSTISYAKKVAQFMSCNLKYLFLALPME